MIAFARNDAPEDTDRTACPCPESPPGPDHSDAVAEMDELARELAVAFGERLKEYREHAKLTAEEAAKHVVENSPEDADRILNTPPDVVSWLELHALGETDPNLALECWEKIKEAARNEIRTGYRASRVIEDASGPFERARFAAVRADLIEGLRPRDAVEKHLVDQLAQWQVLLWRWQEAVSNWTNIASITPRQAKKGESYQTMRMSEAEALERAMKKVEQLHGLYLRTLRALQDQRRPRPPIAVRHAEQVNVGPVRVSVDNLAFSSDYNEALP